MVRSAALCMMALLALAGCETGPSYSSSGVYQLDADDLPTVQANVLESVNFMRSSAGMAPLRVDPVLTSVAQSHADDMSRQQRAWPFGRDGSNPYDRVFRAGYSGDLVSEFYSQSISDTELETLTAWIQDDAWGPALLDPRASDMGLAYHQDVNGMTWWVMILGSPVALDPSFLPAAAEEDQGVI